MASNKRLVPIVLYAVVASALALVLSPQAAYSQFGKNKVQYRTFDWKYIQSQHFDVYFYEESGEYMAKFTAEVAEKALAELEDHLRFRITSRVVIVTYHSKNDFQQTNVVNAYMPEGVGGVTELYKNRVVVPFEGDWEKFRHVIHHELVHAFLNEKFYGGSVQSLISNDIRVILPIWMNEGLAEYESQNGYDVETDMFIRDAVIGGYLPPLQYLGGYFAYRGGQAFYWYVAQTYGREKIGELLDRIKVSSSLDAAFQGAFGKSVEEFSDQWIYDLKKIYWPDIADRKRPVDFAQALTNHEKDESFMNSAPSVSPDGNWAAFISDRDGPRSIYVMELAKPSNVEEIVTGETNVDFEELHLLSPGIAWSPDSRKIALAVKSGEQDAIFVIDGKSGDQQRLTFGLDAIYSVSWSHDGKKLAFQGIKGELSDIYTYEFANKELRNITEDLYSDMDPKWAPDSETLYFLSDRAENPIRTAKRDGFVMWNYDYNARDIYSVNVATLELKRITNTKEIKEVSPTPGPDGKLLFSSDENGIGNIYLMDIATGASRAITNSISGIEQISLSVDGSKLLFSSWNGTGYDVFMMRMPYEQRLDSNTLDKTTYLKKQTTVTSVFADSSASSEAVTVVTPVEGYDDVKIDMSDAAIADAPADLPSAGRAIPDVPVPADALTDDGDYRVKDYKVSFSPDIIQATGGYSSFYGVQGLVQMLFSDMLGDHQIYVATDLQLDLANSDFVVVYNYLPERIDYEIGAFQNSVSLRLGSDENFEPARFRQYGITTKASNPFDKFRRLELGLDVMGATREALNVETSLTDQSKWLLLPSISYVFDNSEDWIFNPISGSRYTVKALASPKLGSGGVGFYSFLGDFRHYIPLGKGYYSLAARFSGAASFGPSPQQFFIGGMDGWWLNYDFGGGGIPLSDAEDLSLLTPGYPLRGYDYGEQTGSKYAITNVEFRFPLIQALGSGILPVLFQYVSGAMFLDVGSAWNDNLNLTTTNVDGKTVTDDLLIGTGIGARTILFGLPARLDVAWRYDLNVWSKPKYYFSLGTDF